MLVLRILPFYVCEKVVVSYSKTFLCLFQHATDALFEYVNKHVYISSPCGIHTSQNQFLIQDFLRVTNPGMFSDIINVFTTQ